jgi:ornithine decarboxylase
MDRHQRNLSFHDVDEAQASGILADVFRESDVYLGGSSVGKGLKKAARYYLEDRLAGAPKPSHLLLPGAADLNPDADTMPLEEAFYVIDLGVVVSQVYQWRKHFPRVEPFYAVKCNPDPVIVKTLAVLGCNFDCASRNEIRLVEEVTKDLPRKPDIIYANPCKARAHLLEAVCKGVRLVTFDNATEVLKCAAVSKKIELILRIITDDRGSQCRLSSKFGAPRTKWRPLLAAAQKNGLQVVGVSFHVGSGCRDASRYEMALKDAREIFDMAEKDFGMHMRILDIGGGFPGETHSMWNPAVEIDEDEADPDEGKEDIAKEEEVVEEDRFMFFNEIAAQVAPVIDQLFPPEDGVRVIGEPGRYLVAACATLCCSVVSTRSNEVDTSFMPEAINDMEAAQGLNDMSREETENIVHKRGASISMQAGLDDDVMNTISEELNDYSKLFASQQLAQQEVDVYADSLDLYHEGFQSAADLLGPPDEDQMKRMHHTVEGMSYPLVASSGYFGGEEQEPSAMLTLAAAGEAAVNGMVLQAVADSTPLQDDYAYYINDGVYGGTLSKIVWNDLCIFETRFLNHHCRVCFHSLQ